MYCGQMAAWIKMPFGTEAGLGPGDIVLHGDPAPPPHKVHGAPLLWPMSVVAKRSPISATAEHLLWSPYVIGQTIIFLPCDFYLLSFFFSSPNLSGCRLDVYHTSTHGVALVQI